MWPGRVPNGTVVVVPGLWLMNHAIVSEISYLCYWHPQESSPSVQDSFMQDYITSQELGLHVKCAFCHLCVSRYLLLYSARPLGQSDNTFDLWPHAKYVESSKWQSSKRSRDDAVLSSATHPVHGSVSEVNCSGADLQVVSCHSLVPRLFLSNFSTHPLGRVWEPNYSCHGCLVFHPFVEQLTVFYISGLVLACPWASQFKPYTSLIDVI